MHSLFYAIRAGSNYAVAPTYSFAFDRAIDGLSSFFGATRVTMVDVLSSTAWALRVFMTGSLVFLGVLFRLNLGRIDLGPVLIFAAYALLWAPLTLLAIGIGVPPSAWLWPLAPLWTALLIQAALRYLIAHWRILLLTLFAFAPLFFGTELLLLQLITTYASPIASDFPVFIVVIGLLTVAASANAMFVRQHHIREDKRYCAGLVANRTPLDAAGAAEALVVLRTNIGIQGLARALRREELPCTDTAVAFFDDLTATLRASKEAAKSRPDELRMLWWRRSKNAGLVAASGVSAEFQVWLDKRNALVKERQKLEAVSLDTIDQLSELVGRRLTTGDDRVSTLG
jgi:hypothetical protein